MDQRKVYRISLKILTLLGVIIIMAVMINSLFPVENTVKEGQSPADNNALPTVTLSVNSLLPGKMMWVQWRGKPVAILKRIDPPDDFVQGEPLNKQWRSIKAEYFVFHNTVGVTQCPLYLMPSGDQLKDTCSGILYDSSGQRISGSGSALLIPPHYFESDEKATVIIGKWSAD